MSLKLQSHLSSWRISGLADSKAYNPSLLPTMGCAQIRTIALQLLDSQLFVALRGRVSPLFSCGSILRVDPLAFLV